MKVILYSTGCPRCNILKQKLNEKEIDFEVIEDEDLMIQKGFTNVPILEVDNKEMDFGDAVRWINGV